ncbi:MAG: phosphoglucomutase/phosphomannomutase family protein [Desulfobacterales bacterium]|nr:phosphoglucomutase/phosphomannomutase family protein [Pseudomonadota bacterium]MCG2772019.1 phosphoglucomutase/phosphomannomutase family protein [Desulfobacterales bacterium]
MTEIKFGTSGWRGILAEDFTFPNARLVCQAIADYLQQEGLAHQGVVIGYDTRFQSEAFAATAAEVMAGNGITSHLTTRDCPTPVVSYAIQAGKRAGGINITASHNPPEYNGLKFSPATGGPAPSTVTNAIESRIGALTPAAVKTMPVAHAREKGLVVDLEPRADYFEHLKTLVDLEVLRGSGLKVVVDVLYGTGRDYLDAFLQEAGVEVELLNGYRDAYFGGHRPEPCEEFLQDLSARVKATGAHLGLAVDADADRFGVMDGAGVYRDANTVLGLLFDYLIETRGWDGGVARSVATTHLLDRIAARYNRPVYVTKVGFKHLGEYINNDQVVMIGEESEGFSMKHHLPEKDGILAGIMIAEMVARKGKGLPELIADLFAKVGPVYNRRLNFSLTPVVKERLLVRLQTPPTRFAGLAVAEHITLDGHKYLLEDGSWVCFRPSGTEPVVRFYFEASSLEALERLRGAGEALIRET